MATLAILEEPNPQDVGVVKMSTENRILNFIEKPSDGTEADSLKNGGIYILEKRILDHIPDSDYSDFAYDIFPRLIERKLPVYGYVLKSEDYLIDIGTIKNYRKANDDAKAGKVKTGYEK